jgi:hypothetical protein
MVNRAPTPFALSLVRHNLTASRDLSTVVPAKPRHKARIRASSTRYGVAPSRDPQTLAAAAGRSGGWDTSSVNELELVAMPKETY